MRNKYNNIKGVHFFKRSKFDEFIIQTPASVGNFSLPLYSDTTNSVYNDFELKHLPDYTEISDLYDTYKICGVRQKFIFSANSSNVGTTLTPIGMPNLVTVHDYNTNSALSTETEALQFTTYKSRRLDRPISRFFKPTQSVVGFTQIVKRRWNPTTFPDIKHMGIRSFVQGYNFTTDVVTLGVLKVVTTYYVAMRTPK